VEDFLVPSLQSYDAGDPSRIVRDERVGTAIQKHLDYRAFPPLCGTMKRSTSVRFGSIRIGAPLEKELDQLWTLTQNRGVERLVLVVVG
jgi:hypothetical protein